MTDRLPFDDDDDEGVYLFVEVRDLLRFQVTNLSLSSKILFFFVSLLLLLLFVSLSLDQFFWLTKILLAHKTLCLKHIIHFVKIIVVLYIPSVTEDFCS